MTDVRATHHRDDVAVVASMRSLLLLAALLVFLAGLPLVVFPSHTAQWFAWTIDVRMTAGFLGAGYWASAVLEIAGARSAAWRRAKLTVWAVLVFTVLTLVVTLLHLDKFHLGALQPLSARAVAWGWLAVYVVVPVVMLVVLLAQARQRGTADPRHSPASRPLPLALRALLGLLALGLIGTGIALLVDPTSLAAHWPWPLTPLTARAIAAWLVGLGWAAGHALLIDDAASVRPLGLTGITFVLLQVLALVRYGDSLDWSSPGAWTYAGGLAATGLAAGSILALRTVTRVG